MYEDLLQGLNSQKVVIANWIAKGKGNGQVEAVAGSGKTKMLEVGCKIIKRMNPKASIVLVAYNNKIAAELSDRVPPSIAIVKTFHALGFGAWRRVAEGVQLDENKHKTIAAELKVPKDLQQFVKNIVSLAKNDAFGITRDAGDTENWMGLVDKHDLERLLADDSGNMPDDIEAAIEKGVKFAQEALELSHKMSWSVIDFDDMIYAPLRHNVKFFLNDWSMVDEVQDSNPVRMIMTDRITKPRGRSLFVGDRFQAIYGFTGADSDSMETIAKMFNTTELPMTQTFRCPKAVVRYAQQWVNHIEAADEAPEGEVLFMELDELVATAKTMSLSFKDAILCRNTKPLVELAYSFIAKGIPCHVEGKDIGKGLIALAGRWKSIVNARILAEKLIDYKTKMVKKFMDAGKEVQAGSIEDKVDTLLVIINALPSGSTVDDVRAQIEKLFSDNEKTLTLSTIHKSKGREWDRVFWLGRARYQPSPYATQDWQLKQETNLMYVAATRAKKTLIEVNVPKKQKYNY